MEEMKELELHLGGEPPEHGELDAALLSREVTARLGERADGPLQIADDLPVVERRERDVPAGERVVALEIRLHLADAAEAQLIDPEAPRPHQRPRDIFGRVAAVPELPIEHVTEAHRGDREVADPQVTMEDDRLAPHQQLALSLRRAQLEGPGLLRRTAREEGETLDRDVRAEYWDEALAQLDGKGGVGLRRQSTRA